MYSPFLLRFYEGYQFEYSRTSILIAAPDPIHFMIWLVIPRSTREQATTNMCYFFVLL